ncbi:MAG: trigger factor [Patescibacteria group bacterium]|jgi:trigger factor
MKVDKNNDKKELEITVEISWEELKPYLEEAAKKISKDVKVEGFRPGNVPYDVLKNKIGEMEILQEAANAAVGKTANKVLKDEIKEDEHLIGQPQVKITKIAVGNPVQYKINISLMPEIKLGKYRELGIKQKEVEIKDGEVEKVIVDLQNMRAKEKIADREVKDGDKVLVDIDMFLDKVPVEGGQGKGTAVMVGGDYIIPGFDKELIGAKKGDVREFKLPYPKEHFQKNLAGKMVEFKVKINEIYEREVPKANDEFAKTLGAKSMEEVGKQIKENLEAEQKQKTEQKTVLEIFEAILKNSTFSHMPETIVHTEAHNMIHELKHNVEQQGAKFEDYLAHIKKSTEDLEKELMPEAEKRVKTSLMIGEIVKLEKIKIEEKELNEAVEKQLAVYKDNSEMKQKANTPEFRDYLHYNLMNQKVVNKLKEWNVIS